MSASSHRTRRGCGLFGSNAGVLPDDLSGLGDRIVYILVSGGTQRARLGAVREGAALCQRLLKIQWWGCSSSVPILEAMLSSGCNNLQSLVLHRGPSPSMNVIASCLSTLCDFRILHCSYSPQLFDSFARSNAHLHIVDIEINLLRECSELSEEGICIENCQVV